MSAVNNQSNESNLEETTTFAADVMLGALARHLTLAGLDCSYHNSISDSKLLSHSQNEERVLLTKDKDLAERAKDSTPHVLFTSNNTRDQMKKLLNKFELQIKPETVFTRCPRCNIPLNSVKKEEVLEHVPDETKKWIDDYYRCPDCGKIYWKGSHYEDVIEKFRRWNVINE